jgi:hypothetical protein
MLAPIARAFLLLLLLAMTSLSFAQTDPATAEALMRKTGLWRQMGSIHLQIKAGFREALLQRAEKPGQAETERMLRAIDAAYEDDRLRKAALKELSQAANPGLLSAVFAWYDSATGTAITKLEETSSEDGRPPSVIEAEGQRAFSEASPERKKIIETLVQVTGATEAMASMSINTTLAILQGVSQASPGTAMPALPSLRRELEKQKPLIEKSLSRTFLGAFAVAYRSLNDADLQAYASFLGSDSGRHITAISLRGFEAAMIDAARVFGQGIVGAAEKSNT